MCTRQGRGSPLIQEVIDKMMELDPEAKDPEAEELWCSFRAYLLATPEGRAWLRTMKESLTSQTR